MLLYFRKKSLFTLLSFNYNEHKSYLKIGKEIKLTPQISFVFRLIDETLPCKFLHVTETLFSFPLMEGSSSRGARETQSTLRTSVAAPETAEQPFDYSLTPRLCLS